MAGKLSTVLFVIIIAITTASLAIGCNISDQAAIRSANEFCKRLGIKFSKEPRILTTDYALTLTNSERKTVVFGERGYFKGFIDVSCDNKEVDSYLNSEIRDKVRKKYNISPVTGGPHNGPPFLSEIEAKKKIFSIAKRVGLPPDVEFTQQLSIDKENGRISGQWRRKLNGYPYEDNRIQIEIMAVDGEFISYSRMYYGKNCPTEVKVTKEEAIKEGLKQIDRLFHPIPWSFRRHVIYSAELKIVQPNTLAGKIVRQHSTESRLAWVLQYELKNADNRKAESLQMVKIIIDAATKKFLGGDRSR